jgi:hypothetical protein
MDQGQVSQTPRRKLLRGSRWPRDRHRVELDIDDIVNFAYYGGGSPHPAFGKIVRIGKTGKITVETIDVFGSKSGEEVLIKECSMVVKMSPQIVAALLLTKLARD